MSISQNVTLITIVVIVIAVLVGSVLSPANIIQILGFGGTTITLLVSLLKMDAVAVKQEVATAQVAVVAQKQEQAAAAVVEVKRALEASDQNVTTTLASIAEVADQTHALVNSNMGAQLKVSAVALRRVAHLTSDLEDVAAAELAERALEEHVAKQSRADLGQNKA